jgi:tetratricopeptide (TPR) repeat protein
MAHTSLARIDASFAGSPTFDAERAAAQSPISPPPRTHSKTSWTTIDTVNGCVAVFAPFSPIASHPPPLPVPFEREALLNAMAKEIMFYEKQLQASDPSSAAYDEVSKLLTRAANAAALLALEFRDAALADRLLKRAEELTRAGARADDEAFLALRSITFNNIACMFRVVGQFEASLRFLHVALNSELRSSAPEDPETTHLNLAASLAALGHGVAALQHVECAIAIIRARLEDASGGGGAEERFALRFKLALALHSAAGVLEGLGRLTDALVVLERLCAAFRSLFGEGGGQTREAQRLWRRLAHRLGLKIIGGRGGDAKLRTDVPICVILLFFWFLFLNWCQSVQSEFFSKVTFLRFSLFFFFFFFISFWSSFESQVNVFGSLLFI